MKQVFLITIVALSYLIITPAFQCGDRPTDNCPSYRTDTVLLPFFVTNSSSSYRVNDTIRLFSRVSDTLVTAGGSNFITALPSLHAGINVYKVISNPFPQLNFANNQFNALVNTGTFQNTGSTGFEILYLRNDPVNILSASLIPGQPGLYLVTVYLSRYSYAIGNDLDLYEPNNYCTSYKGIVTIPVVQQQRQYWDSIGTTSLNLANSNYNFIMKKNTNYFFIKVTL
ncbi:MAG: hypothetical protein WKF35_11420 [Ferruginibacter sp.]